ncbi:MULTISPECIES: YraN family protein [unclassified Herbaspirillum]|uniref:YraN family protein n=1 Tax=unclassified Herbaspirillum TaxID=2624150 RepID=UPI00115138F0|nr:MULTISPECIES: YraN family protein [unclassified Herbaspirillum]MBB5389936.1 putative endonuclease [Herbaspirillum sp. SJZ102]TQK09553.1 putative endonuclease [Herbaspirillum sp. SJZ130]TQK13760.1 putative endonuclease [Herbaspirillum sp. SJZ106]TWC69478.1 putative endonuclease [Herbaspirillum sp. SJZ099]
MGLFDRWRRAAGDAQPARSDSRSDSRTGRQRTGDAAEDAALAYLRRRGLELVERNFQCKGGEIDLVMRDGATLVFVEVRARASRSHGGAAASITPAKQRRLIVAAHLFLQRYASAPPCRFDVLGFDGEEVEWLRNAIEE